MTDSTDLRRRLRRMSKPPKRGVRPQPSVARPSQLPAGVELETPAGTAYRIENEYQISYQHGGTVLGDLLGFEPALAAEVAGSPELGEADLAKLVFVDLETTGLVGGAGTLGFLIGLGRFEGDRFVLRQYFLRDPAQEAGMLQALAADLEAAAGVVSFNGRNFDMPLLEMRYALALRHTGRLTGLPQLDLLYPARRLWSRGLPNCRLGTLERQVLGVERSEQDVPGELIPGLYLDYLRTGDASEMARVVYHNAVDILSLVGLATEVLRRHQPSDPADLSGEEALAVARWHQGSGRGTPAEAAFQVAVQRSGSNEIGVEAQRQYAAYLKRQGRRAEAVSSWEAWHRLKDDDPQPCIELAMYYEWHKKDLQRAHHWTQEGLMAISSWPADWRRDRARAELEHRLSRLERKLRAAAEESGKP